ncbi:serine protease [Streptococcus vestibularis]|uniref:trypsin-like serine peptidase n=1 Tax=Streptococcus vestibularis TaxID=1343 RepID=UPI002673FD9A|nr:trypsin-like serine protease [Streptococcus vestibularis]
MREKIEMYIGILSYRGIGNGRQKGTGCIFHYKERWILATAAHCVYNIDEDTFYTDFKFTQPSSNKEYILGDVFLHKFWPSLYAPEYDIAFFNINCADSFSNLDRMYLTPCFAPLVDKKFMIVGFPGKIIFRNKLYIKKDNNGISDSLYSSNLIGIRTNKKEGMSGGPLICQNKDGLNIVGTISLSFVSEKGILWCAPWNKDFEIILDFLTGDKKVEPEFMVIHSWKS